MTKLTLQDRIAGSVFGLAYGDTWGYITEFYDYKTILSSLPDYPYGNPRISDDTQMSIYNMTALNDIITNVDLTSPELHLASNPDLQDKIRTIFADWHVKWMNSPDNNRAPGTACMTALAAYSDSARETGLEGSSLNNSKGCGANMRSPWLGLLPYTPDVIVSLSILQAQTSHGNPTAQVAAAVTSMTVYDIVHENVQGGELLPHARKIIARLSDGSYGWDVRSWENMESGLNEMDALLRDGSHSYERYKVHPVGDISAVFGEGWVADEALLTALAAADLFHDDTRKGVEKLVYTKGDSDSIAAIGGAFLGALNGRESIPVETSDFETGYSTLLESIVSFLSDLNKNAGTVQ